MIFVDLKGAPPKLSYVAELLPLLSSSGATDLLIEYEDMFPYWGSLKLVLKLEQFKNLREEPSYPQSLCPSKEEAVTMVRTMGNEIMEIHRDSTHIHIGCDEVSM